MNADGNDLAVDHKNNNKLDNRKSNLRFVTMKQNAQNSVKQKNATSDYIGVRRAGKGRNCWKARIGGEHLGSFEFEIDAAFAYDEAARRIYGPDAKVNGVKITHKARAIARERKNQNVEINGEKIPGLLIIHTSLGNVRYQLQGKVMNKKFTKNFISLDEAISEHTRLKNLPKPEIVGNRNSDGIAILDSGALVDDDIYLKYCNQSSTASAGGYPAVRENGKLTTLHRLVIGAKKGEIVDHIDRNYFKSLRANLRIVSRSENAFNRTKRKNASSKYFNVSRHDSTHFEVFVNKDRKKYSGGLYEDDKVAAWAATQLSRQLYGEEHTKENNVILENYVFVNNRAVKKEPKSTLISEFFRVEDTQLAKRARIV